MPKAWGKSTDFFVHMYEKRGRPCIPPNHIHMLCASMRTVEVDLGNRAYPIVIARDLLSSLGHECR